MSTDIFSCFPQSCFPSSQRTWDVRVRSNSIALSITHLSRLTIFGIDEIQSSLIRQWGMPSSIIFAIIPQTSSDFAPRQSPSRKPCPSTNCPMKLFNPSSNSFRAIHFVNVRLSKNLGISKIWQDVTHSIST
jgi:hypothetical protein